MSIPASLNPGGKYKRLVRESFVSKLVNLPVKLEEILEERFKVSNIELRKACVQSILALSDVGSLHERVREILLPVLQEKDLRTAEYQIVDILGKCEHIEKKQTYFGYLKYLFSAIIIQSICKAKKICGDTYDISRAEMKEVFFELDLEKVLLKQNIASRDIDQGIIWVLNTCVLFVADYSFDLIEFV